MLRLLSCFPAACRLKPLRNLLSLQLHAREIRGTLPPALFRCLNRLQHLAISGGLLRGPDPFWPGKPYCRDATASLLHVYVARYCMGLAHAALPPHSPPRY